MLGDYELPPPKDWQKFERLCRDLWAAIWDDPNTEANGRSGQPQAGVDVFGRRSGSPGYSAVQCKKRQDGPDSGEISAEELRTEVEKAKTFRPQLTGEFILAFTGRRDAKIQTVAREISSEHARAGLFQVSVYSWDDIQERLNEHPEVVGNHYLGVMATFREYARLLPDPTPIESDGRTHSPLSRSAAVIEPNVLHADAEFSADIQLVRSALKAGHASLALSQGQALRARIWDLAGGVTRARLLVLIAHAHLELGRTEEASKLLLEAAGQAPGDSYVQAQVALGHSLAGNEDAARTWAAKALQQNPTEIVAVQVAVLHDPRSDEQVLAAHEAIIGKRAEVYAVLAHRAVHRQERAKARAWFEQAVALDPENPDVLAAAGQSIVDAVAAAATSRFDGTMAARPDLLRAVQLLDDALSRVIDDDVRKSKSSWFAARILAKRLLMADDTAEATDAALVACGRPLELVRLRAVIASEAGDHAKVIELLKDLPTPREFDDVGLLAAAYGNLGQLDQSTNLWLELLARDELPEHIRYEAARGHAFSLILANKPEAAKAAVTEALAAAPESLSALLVAVAVAERLSEPDERDRLLERAVSIAAGGSEDLRLQLGDALMRAERWADASEVYGVIVGEGNDTYYGRRYLEALYRSGRYKTLLRACDAVQEKHGISRYLAEMRSSVFELLGDLDRAAQACRDFLKVDPTNAVLGLRLALVLQRGGDIVESERALSSVDAKAIPDVESAGMLADMLLRVGRPRDALEVAYQMRSRHAGDVKAHLRYVSLYLAAKSSVEPEQPTPIGLDSAVQLTGTGAPGWILVSASEKADINQKEYPPRHRLSLALLGKRVGDVVPIVSVDKPWKIAATGTKYGFAFGRTMEVFPSHFHGETGLEQHDFGDGGTDQFVEDVKNRLKQGEPRRESILNEYAAGRLGVGSVARALGLTIWQSIGTLLSSSHGLICCTNTRDELAAGLAALRSGQATLLLDATAIIGLESVGLLRDATLSRHKLAVAQRTLDEFSVEYFRWKAMSDDGSLSLSVEGDTLVKHETSPSDVAQMRSHLQTLIEWLRANVRVLPVSPEAAEQHSKHDQINDLIGGSAWDTVRIASAQNTILVSDDLWLRRLAQSEMSATSVCAAVVLMAEVESGRLDRSRYSEAIARMTVVGYRSLPIDSSILEAAARMDQWRPGTWLSKVLGMLRGPEVQAQSAVVVAGDFIRAIWLNVVLSGQRTALLLAVLDALAVGRGRSDVASALQVYLKRRLQLLPLALEEAVRVVAGWASLRGIEILGG